MRLAGLIMMLAMVAATARADSAVVVAKLGGTMQFEPIAIVDLPKCDQDSDGSLAAVKDAAEPTYRQPVLVGGIETVLVFCNGHAWIAH
jgi:hypothetical protein